MEKRVVSIDGVRFEALRAGSNQVVVAVTNHSDEKCVFCVHIQSYGYLGGFGRPSFRELSPCEQTELCIGYDLRGEPNELSWVRLRYYELLSVDSYQFDDYCGEEWFRGPKLEPYRPAEGVASRRVPEIFFDDALASTLGKMIQRKTEHFDLYCSPGSTASAELEQIADLRQQLMAAIAQWLGLTDTPHVRLILFEDGAEKLQRTGHQGDGWAFDTTIVEVYNAHVRLDPVHEVTHILAEQIGYPSALLREGLATYMAEAMGYRFLLGAQLTLYERCREILQKGDWIPLDRLLSFTNIGPEESNPAVSYAEAGAFVRYVVEEHGRDRLLKAYAALKNPRTDDVNAANRAQLESLLGLTIGELEQQCCAQIGRAS